MPILPTKAPTGSDWPEFDREALDGELGTMTSPGQKADTRLIRAKLAEAAKAHLQKIENYYQSQRAAYVDRMPVKDVTPDINRVRDEAIDELQSLTSREGTTIEAMHKDCSRRLHDYEHFRHQNDLTREPYYPEDRLRHVLLAVVALVAESLLNASMLAIGSTGGLIGGWFIAITIACLNVGGAFVGGNLARLVHDRSWARRTLGYVSIGSIGLVLIAFNLLVAHYREALVIAATQGYEETMSAGRVALESFREDYFGASDFMSWTLFGLGLLSAALGAWKGYTIEDPYPGFSRRARALKHAETEFRDELEEALEDVAEIQRSRTREVNQYADEYRGRLASSQTLRSQVGSLRRRLDSEFKTLDAKVEFLHAKHCPDEDAVVIGELAPREPLPDVDEDHSARIEQSAAAARETLVERTNAAVERLKAA